MGKRIATSSLILTIMCISFLVGYTQVLSVPVYAGVNDDQYYVPLRSENDLVKAFQSYCKSRDLTIEGSSTDAVTTFTTSTFNFIANSIGIDITELQAEIKADYDNAGVPVKFAFTQLGINAMNRIFAQLLQDNELQVGDSVNDKVAYNGYSHEGKLVWVVSSAGNHSDDSFILQRGTYEIDKTQALSLTASSGTSLVPYEFELGGTTYTSNLRRVNSNMSGTSESYVVIRAPSSTSNQYFVSVNSNYIAEGGVCWGTNGTSFGLYVYSHIPTESNGYYYKFYALKTISVNTSTDLTAVNVYYTTNNKVINNNTYEGDTYITNEGDVINNPAPTQPNNPNDTITNIPQNPISQNPDGGWDIDLPDLDIPNLPLGNLSEKFPFSIPWDLVAFYAMMDAEPEAPRFNGTLDLWVVDWDFDIDLSPFDSAAELCRKLQFGLFVVGLIVATRDLIRG